MRTSHPNQTDRDAAQVALMFQLADQLKAAEKTLGLIQTGRATFDTLADKPTYLGDMSDLANEIEVIADIWQEELDLDVVHLDRDHEAVAERS